MKTSTDVSLSCTLKTQLLKDVTFHTPVSHLKHTAAHALFKLLNESDAVLSTEELFPAVII